MERQPEKLRCRPEILLLWSQRNKCFMCKRRFERPFLLPVAKPVRGLSQPNFNVEAIFHLADTHGVPDDISRQWIVGSIYGLETNEFGAKGLGNLFREDEA